MTVCDIRLLKEIGLNLSRYQKKILGVHISFSKVFLGKQSLIAEYDTYQRELSPYPLYSLTSASTSNKCNMLRC